MVLDRSHSYKKLQNTDIMNWRSTNLTFSSFFFVKYQNIIETQFYTEVIMGNDIDVFTKLEMIDDSPQFAMLFEDESESAQKIAQHKIWLQSIRHERPSVNKPFRVGIYIRYFNQTKYTDYIEYHKKQFEDSISLCPKWQLVDFYIDEGSTAPRMEYAKEWSRLLEDCMEGKVDLIITQKVSNVSRDMTEIAICTRLLAAQDPPIGIYFVSEDIFSLASYYQDDLHDTFFLPEGMTMSLPDDI